jgi:hypothetical protein
MMEEELHNLVATAKEMIHRRSLTHAKRCSRRHVSVSAQRGAHNLMGLLLEKKRKHEDAMKHFRAAKRA